MSKILFTACLGLLPAIAQSSGSFQTGAIYVVNSASRRQAQTAASGLAPGSLCDINITGIYQQFGGSLLQGDTVTLRFRAPGAAVARDLTLISSTQSAFEIQTQFTALIPTDAPAGRAEILAVAASGKTYATTVWIAASGFGLFTKTGAGYDAAKAQVFRDRILTTGLTTPVHEGDWVALWGTGLGSGASTVLVDVAGIGVVPAYAGPAPGFPGLDQINFRFPAGVPDDCYIPLTVRVGDAMSNTTTIATASTPGNCRHRLGLSADALAALDAGGQVPLSQSWVHSDVYPNPDSPTTYRRYDSVSLEFRQKDASAVQLATGLLTNRVQGCQLNLDGGTYGYILLSQVFDAGTPVVTGPGGVHLQMDGTFGYYTTKSSETTYTLSAVPPSSFTPGDWAVETTGGTTIGAFRIALRVPPALRWINRGTVSPVSRESDLALKWDPTGYTNQEWMQGSVGVGQGSVICQAPATAGLITVPHSLISQLPAPTGLGAMVQLLLTPANTNLQLYSAPLVERGSIPGISTYSYLEAVLVELTPAISQ